MRALLKRGIPVVALASLVIFVSMLPVIASCGSTSHEKTISTTISTTFTTMNAASDAFAAWDKAHQDAIVKTAITEAEATSKIAAYRARRAPVIDMIAGIYKLLSAAAIAQNDATVTTLLAAVKPLQDAFAAFKKAEGATP